MGNGHWGIGQWRREAAVITCIRGCDHVFSASVARLPLGLPWRVRALLTPLRAAERRVPTAHLGGDPPLPAVAPAAYAAPDELATVLVLFWFAPAVRGAAARLEPLAGFLVKGELLALRCCWRGGLRRSRPHTLFPSGLRLRRRAAIRGGGLLGALVAAAKRLVVAVAHRHTTPVCTRTVPAQVGGHHGVTLAVVPWLPPPVGRAAARLLPAALIAGGGGDGREQQHVRRAR